jgi:hypothetical protein
MKAQELRLGNWVEIDTDSGWKPLQVEQIRWQAIASGFNVVHFDEPEKLRPIPLTPEILEAVGFENSSGNTDYIALYLEVGGIDNIIICFHGDKGGILEYSLTCRGADLVPPFEIQHLHQLQNLYYALTGQELNIKL